MTKRHLDTIVSFFFSFFTSHPQRSPSSTTSTWFTGPFPSFAPCPAVPTWTAQAIGKHFFILMVFIKKVYLNFDSIISSARRMKWQLKLRLFVGVLFLTQSRHFFIVQQVGGYRRKFSHCARSWFFINSLLASALASPCLRAICCQLL